MIGRLEKHHPRSFTSRCDRRRKAPRRGAVDDDVGSLGLGGGRRHPREEEDDGGREPAKGMMHHELTVVYVHWCGESL